MVRHPLSLLPLSCLPLLSLNYQFSKRFHVCGNFAKRVQAARPAVEKGRHVPDPHTIKELLKDKEAVEKHAAESRAWVQKGMREDAERLKK